MANPRFIIRLPKLTPRLLGLALLLALANTGWAHTVQLFVHVDGPLVRGVATFYGGAPVADATVDVSGGGGKDTATLTTDAEGRFVYQPPARQDYVFSLETEDGHRVAYEIKGDWLATADQPAADAPAVDGAAFARIEARLDSLEKTLRLRDILGGMGYIAGIMGLLFWWKARQRMRQ